MTVRVSEQFVTSGQERLERTEMVRALLAKLSRDEQEAAVYYFVDEMSQDEAAAACGCSVPTLRKRLRRFIEVARKQLKRDDADVGFWRCRSGGQMTCGVMQRTFCFLF